MPHQITTSSDAIGAGEGTLQRTPDHDAAFRCAPIALWEEDFSAVARWCDEQRDAGMMSDPRSYLRSHPEELRRIASSIVVIAANEAAARLVGAPSVAALEGPLAPEIISDTSLESFLAQIEAVWRGVDRLSLVMEGQTFAGVAMDCSMHWAVPTIDGRRRFDRVVVAIEDVTERRAAQRELERMVETLFVLYDVAKEVTEVLELKPALEKIVERTHHVTGADKVILLLVDQDRQELLGAVGYNYPEALLSTHTYREVMDGISGWVIEHAASAVSECIQTDPRNTGAALARALEATPMSAVISPITAGRQVLGTLTLLSEDISGPLDEGDLWVTEMLAGHAAIAIQNARLFDNANRQQRELEAAVVELQATQTKLLQAQKLEAIGALAAGVAHEINTPIQYIGDNTRFLDEALMEVLEVARLARELAANAAAGAACAAEDAQRLLNAIEDADLDYLLEETPEAIRQTLEGVDRVAEIVRALKEFAHPGSEQRSPVDLNRAIETTVMVARNEWKYVADLELQLEPSLPPVPALAGPLKQSLLIIIVNAAQAIASSLAGDAKGHIVVSSSTDGDHAVVRISDDGPGIPESIQDRIFEPFFTTKDIGEGSGQGLSIARNVVVERHGGSLDFETGPGGTTFILRLPLGEECDDGA